MSRWAVIRDGRVETVALWDGETPWDPGDVEVIACDDWPYASEGWTWDGATFTPPAADVDEGG